MAKVRYKIHADKRAKALLETARSRGLLMTNQLMRPLIREEEVVLTQQELDEMKMDFEIALQNCQKVYRRIVKLVEEGRTAA